MGERAEVRVQSKENFVLLGVSKYPGLYSSPSSLWLQPGRGDYGMGQDFGQCWGRLLLTSPSQVSEFWPFLSWKVVPPGARRANPRLEVFKCKSQVLLTPNLGALGEE